MPGSREVLDSWGNAKWKEGQAAPAWAEETTQLLKGEREGLEWNELSCRIYHSDSEIKGVRLLSCPKSRSSSRICGGRERGKGDGRGGVGPNGEARSVWKPARVWGGPIQIAAQPAANLLYDSERVISSLLYNEAIGRIPEGASACPTSSPQLASLIAFY